MNDNECPETSFVESTVPTVTGVPFFEYKALRSTEHIRQLILDPGKGNDPLIGHVKEIKLDDVLDQSPFEAISYVWGSSVRDQWMILNGSQLRITTSMTETLRQVRLQHQSRTLWADSICINQDDNEEKGQQVALMGRIYQTSRCTLICLGPNSQDAANEVASLVADINGMIQRIFDDPKFSWSWDTFPYPSADDLFVKNEPRWESWITLLTHSWFKRGWVVQEAALGPDARVLWAGVEIPWFDVLRVESWLMMREYPLIPTLAQRPLTISAILARIYALRRPEEVKTLWAESSHNLKAMTTLQILDYARARDLTNPKDRIYAFMALPTSDGAMPALQPDYAEDMPYLEIYRQFAVKYLQKTFDLDLLVRVEHDTDDDIENSISPSWTPRWDRGRFGYPVSDPSYAKIEGDDHQHAQNMALVEHNSILRVNAALLGTVKYASQELGSSRPDHPIEEMVLLWREIAPLSLKQFPGPHQDRLSLAFVGALCGGSYDGGWEEWIKSRNEFAHLLQSDQQHTQLPIANFSVDENAQVISRLVARYSRGRKLILLDCGLYGLAPGTTRKGDVCSVIFGAQLPFILRKVDKEKEEDKYKVIGATFLQSKAVDKDHGMPCRLGENEDSLDWIKQDLQTKHISLC